MSAVAEDDPRLKYVDLEVATTPRDGEVLVNHWWVVHPQRGVMAFMGSPQCNRSKAVGDLLAPKLYPWAEVRQIPAVYLGELRGQR